MRQQDGRRELFHKAGRIVGRLAAAVAPPPEARCTAARVLAVVNRRKEECEPGYLDRVSCERWEVIIPELVFTPNA